MGPSWLCLLMAFCTAFGSPALSGLATHYDCDAHCGQLTRSGELYAADAITAAVDASRYKDLGGRTLMVLAYRPELPSGFDVVFLRVNDCGYLYRAGTFRPRNTWWLRGRSFVDVWVKAEHGQQIVLDVPEDTFRAHFLPNGNTTQVAAWLME